MLHIGAHYGQESKFYEELGVKVIWFEALPENYEMLLYNIRNFPNQIAMMALLGKQNIDNVKFNIANNNGASSSIYSFGKNVSVKNLKMVNSVQLPMKRLDYILRKEQVLEYNHWIIDVQGAELSVCIGAGNLLNYVNSIEIEVSTREEYVDGSNYEELKYFLSNYGFYPLWEPKKDSHEDILFLKK